MFYDYMLTNLAKKNGLTPLERRRKKNSLTGFTYIEVMVTLAVVAVLFIPMMQLFSHALYSVTVSGDQITAVNLGRWEMEKVKNLNLTKAQLKKQPDVWTPDLAEPALEMNAAKWRILRHINPVSDPLQIAVEVYLSDNLKKPIVSLVTLMEDNIWIEDKRETEVRQ